MQAISEERITERLWIIWSVRLTGLLRILHLATV
jgi:hypothetical protein